ncbi:MAG TPA: ABC transporter permease, partial [Salinivirgaceae bacterium]|nr:ABC transporter permease [Salinivirgaceae bacterium]
ILDALPLSLLRAVFAIGLSVLIGIPLGIIAARTKNSLVDKSIIGFSSLGMSLPSYFAAILMAWIFAFLLKDYTGLSITGSLFEYDLNGKYLAPQNIILPGITLGLRPLSVVVQLTRNSLDQQMKQNYFRTARAKGLSVNQAIRRHALKNALNPVVTAISGWFASMIAGMVFVEYIFSWKGIGFMLVEALNQYDFPVVMGCILIISTIFIGINYLTDFVYTLLDPRIRLSSNNL